MCLIVDTNFITPTKHVSISTLLLLLLVYDLFDFAVLPSGIVCMFYLFYVHLLPDGVINDDYSAANIRAFPSSSSPLLSSSFRELSSKHSSTMI